MLGQTLNCCFDVNAASAEVSCFRSPTVTIERPLWDCLKMVVVVVVVAAVVVVLVVLVLVPILWFRT